MDKTSALKFPSEAAEVDGDDEDDGVLDAAADDLTVGENADEDDDDTLAVAPELALHGVLSATKCQNDNKLKKKKGKTLQRKNKETRFS